MGALWQDVSRHNFVVIHMFSSPMMGTIYCGNMLYSFGRDGSTLMDSMWVWTQPVHLFDVRRTSAVIAHHHQNHQNGLLQ